LRLFDGRDTLSGMRVLGFAVAAAIALSGCGRAPDPPNRPKLVILGFDGLDPDLVKEFMDAGHMPAFKRVMYGGGLFPLETTVSPESPTAWASFATGVNPGKHNIFDFLVRNPRTYVPDLGMVRREPPAFWFDWIPVRRPKIESIRGGTSFWVTAGEAGVRSSILTVPITFPTEHVPNGELLAGLPLPDIRGTMGTFSYFATDISRLEEGNTEFGGILTKLTFRTTPRTRGSSARPIRSSVRRSKPSNKGGRLSRRTRSRWPSSKRCGSHPADGRVVDARQPHGGHHGRRQDHPAQDRRVEQVGRSRLPPQHLREAARHGAAVPHGGRLRAPSVHLADQLSSSLAARADFRAGESVDPAKRLGPFRTLGWAEATWPLDENRTLKRWRTTLPRV
jgi:hypothetical protein